MNLATRISWFVVPAQKKWSRCHDKLCRNFSSSVTLTCESFLSRVTSCLLVFGRDQNQWISFVAVQIWKYINIFSFSYSWSKLRNLPFNLTSKNHIICFQLAVLLNCFLKHWKGAHEEMEQLRNTKSDILRLLSWCEIRKKNCVILCCTRSLVLVFHSTNFLFLLHCRVFEFRVEWEEAIFLWEFIDFSGNFRFVGIPKMF